MSEKKKTTLDINLLPGDELGNRPGGRILLWALSWGKKIVIVTELIVVSAFLSRFWLDTQVANLSDQIEHNKETLLALRDFEVEFRSVSDRLVAVKKISVTASVVTILAETEKLVPPEVALSRVTVTGDEISFGGIGYDQALAVMVDNFKSSPRFTDIVLEKVAKENVTPDINFSLVTTFKTQ